MGGLLGLQPCEPLLYARLLAAVDEGRLLPCNLTNQLILDLKELVLVQDSGRFKAVVTNKVTVSQFCHLVALVADKVKFKEEKNLEKKVRRALWRQEKLEKLGEAVASGVVAATDPWLQFRRTFPLEEGAVVQEEAEEVVEKEIVTEEKEAEKKGNQSTYSDDVQVSRTSSSKGEVARSELPAVVAAAAGRRGVVRRSCGAWPASPCRAVCRATCRT